MKCYRGFLTIKDEVTRKEHPFFVKTREEDLVVEQIPLDWKQTSTLFDKSIHNTASEPEIYVGKDYTSYLFKTSVIYSSQVSSHPDGESIYHTNTQGAVIYKLFKDKSYEISGNLTLDRHGTEANIILPYECIGKITSVNFFENIENYVSPMPVKIIPQLIQNPNLNDGETHVFRIDVKNIIGANPLASIGFSIKGINV